MKKFGKKIIAISCIFAWCLLIAFGFSVGSSYASPQQLVSLGEQNQDKSSSLILARVVETPQHPLDHLDNIQKAEASRVYVRNQADSPEAKKDIESLQIALAKMRQMDCRDPLSWYYQGAIHWVANLDPAARSKPYKICPFYRDTQKLLPDWNSCTHVDSYAPSDRNFLAWHRLYLYHFEKIVRALSGDKNFALPYWRYVSLESTDENPGDIFLTMPKAFRIPPDQDNPIYDDERSKRLLNGEEIEPSFVETQLYAPMEAFRTNSDFQYFNENISNSPHGAMHDYIGGTPPENPPKNPFNRIFNEDEGGGLMAEVESAGFDPIFWTHHGNIDRLWDQWTNWHKKYINLNDLHVEGKEDWKYKFFEPVVLPDGTISSKEVNYTLQEVIDKVYNLGYMYDDTPVVQRPVEEVSKPSTPPTLLAKQEVGKVVSSDRPIDLQLPLPPQMATQLAQLSANTSTPTATKGFTLETDVTYTGRPYSRYDVFLNLPNEESKKDINTYYAGSISFFVIPSPEPVTRTFQFDITDELIQQLKKKGEGIDSKNLSISIRKASGPEDEFVTIERVSLYAY